MAFNLINFKRGTLAGLNTLKTNSGIEEGTFYLTIDDNKQTSRLYIGTSATTALPVNSNITVVANKTDLTDTHAAPFNDGDFAYVTNGNILAVKIGTKWQQINTPPTAEDYKYLTDVTYNIATENGVATITWTGTRSDGQSVTDNYTVTGANGITASGSGKALTLTGTSYQMAAPTVTDNTGAIKLQSKSSASATAADVSTVNLKGGSNVTLTSKTSEPNTITINAVDTVNTGLAISNGDTTNGGTGATTGFTVKVTDSKGDVEDHFNPQISVLTNEAGTTKTNISFDNGIAALPVYNKAEVDRKISSLSGMKYAGTINQSQASTKSTGHVGDTYKATEAFSLSQGMSASGAAVAIKPGDLLIVSNSSGTIDADNNVTDGLKFDVVPSGDETVNVYTVTSDTYGIKIHEEPSGNDIGGLKLAPAANSQITLSESTDSNNIKTVTVGHSSITTTATTGDGQAQTDGSPFTFNAVTAISTTNGHVTGVTTTPITVKDTNASLTSITNTVTAGTGNDANKKATVTTAAVLHHTNGDDDNKNTSFSLNSDNLKITASGTTITTNFVWGTF